MNRRPGFILIELTVYAALLGLLTFLIFHWATSTQGHLKKMSNYTLAQAGEWAALDVWARDVRQAPESKQRWYTIASEEVVWQNKDLAIGWKKEGDSLYRYSGNYKSGIWHKYTKSLLCEDVRAATFTVRVDAATQMVKTAALILNAKESSIALRNRSS